MSTPSGNILTNDEIATAAQMRPPQMVMRLARMGSSHATRLSFMRVLLRRLRTDGWRFDRPLWRLDPSGVGVATYSAIGPVRCYTLVCFAHNLPDDQRSDRVIATAWDATFALHDGQPTVDDIQRLAVNVPLQEAGRMSQRELVLSRANRSVRLFDYVVDRLAAGEQPDRQRVATTGYLMRTTAVYGSGKFGLADRERWAERPEFIGSFLPELLCVWLIRSFTVDWVEYLAMLRAPQTSVRLHPERRRQLGVGNATGLGMAPFLLSHATLLHHWIYAREMAYARVRLLPRATSATAAQFSQLIEQARFGITQWHCDHPLQSKRIAALDDDLEHLAQHWFSGLARVSGPRQQTQPWQQLYTWGAEHLSLEGQELLLALIIEPHGELVDDLALILCADERQTFDINGAMTVAALRALIERDYAWALAIDFTAPKAIARVWYVSAEKLEPRLGERFEEPIARYEQPLAPARDVAALYAALTDWNPSAALADFLRQHPQHRYAVRRAQRCARSAYAEIRDNTIDARLLPIDLLRCKLAFFGATRFDPRSDRWVRITMYQHAPYPYELAYTDPDQCFAALGRD